MDFILQSLAAIGVIALLLFLALLIWLLQDDPDDETPHSQPPSQASAKRQTLESHEDIARQAARLKLEQDAAALAAARTMLEIARLYRQE